MTDIVEQAVGEIIVKDSTGAGVASATANFDKLYNAVRYNWWGIQNLGRAFAAVGGIIAAGLGEAAKSSIDFQQGMTQVSRTANLGVEATNELGESLRKMALVKPLDVNQLTQIAAAAGQLGIVGAQNILKFTGVIADLTQTTDLTADSAEQLAKLAGPLNITGDDWSRLGSTILQLGVSTAASESEIVSTAIQLSSLGATAHATTPEIIALSAEINSISKQASSGATGVSRFISQIATMAAGATPKAVAQFKEFASVIGSDSPRAMTQLKKSFNTDAIPVFGNFVTGLAKMHLSTEGFTQELSALGITETREIRILSQMVGAVNQTGEPILRINNILAAGSAAWEKNTALQSQSQKMYSTTAAQLKITENTVKDIAIAFGSGLAKAVETALKPIDDFLRGIDALPAPMKSVIDYVAAGVAGFALLAAATTSLVPRFVLIKTSLAAVKDALAVNTVYAKNLVYAMQQQATTEDEAAAASSRTAARLSKDEQAKVLAAQDAANASRIEAAQSEFAAEADDQHSIAAAKMAEADQLRAEAAEKAALADENQAAANELGVKGMGNLASSANEAAEALRVESVQAAEAADQAELLAKAATDSAAGFEEQAASAGLAEESLIKLETSEVAASGTSYALGAALDAATGPFFLIFGAITAVTAALSIYGAASRQNAQDTLIAGKYNDDLAEAIQAAGNASRGTLAAFYSSDTAFNELAVSIGGAISRLELFNAIAGASNNAALNNALNTLHEQYLAGDKDAAKAAQTLLQEHNDRVETINTINAQIKSQKDLTGSTKEQRDAENGAATATNSAAKASQKETQALQKEKTAHDAINQAALDYPQALLGVKQALEGVVSAQKAYDDAMAEGNTKQRDVLNASDDLKTARLQEEQAIEKVKDAENDLTRARQNEIDAVAAAQDQLTGDTNRLADDQQAIAAAQLKLTEDQATDGMLDLTKAVNALADAYDKLHDATETVADAQYNLNYLLQEGASARDIADAQEQLKEAQDGQADAITGVADAQNGLTEAQQNSGAQQLAQDQRDLSDATLQVSADQRQLTQDTYDLQDAQLALADNSGVIDAQEALQEAQDAVDKGIQQILDDTIALKDAQKETGSDAEKEAAEGLQAALLQLAQAHVAVTKDLALMNGEQFGAGREARALAAELMKLGLTAGGPVAAGIEKMANAIKNAAVSDIKVPTLSSTPSGGGGGLSGIPSGALTEPVPGGGQEAPTPSWVTNATAPAQSWMTSFIDWFKNPTHIKELAAGLLAGLVAAVAIVFSPVELGALAIGAVAALTAAFVTYILSKFGPAIAGAFKTAWNATSGAFEDAWDAVANFFTSTIPGFFEGLWGHISDGLSDAWDAVANFFTSTVPGFFSKVGGDIAQPFKDGYNWVKEHWGDVTGFFEKPVQAASKDFSTVFGDVLDVFKKPWQWVKDTWDSITNDLEKPIDGVATWIGTHFSDVEDAFKKPWQWVRDSWSDIRDFFQTPIVNMLQWFRDHFDTLIGIFSGLPHRVSQAVAGMFDGIKDAFAGAINWIIDKWNDLHFSIPSVHIPLLGTFGGESFGLGHIDPIQLASGGVATKPTLAYIGEGGENEAIVPLSQFANIFAPVDHLAMQMAATNNAMVALLQSMPGGGGSQQSGDTFNITQAQADPMQIAEDIIFKKKVRLR